MESDQPQCGVCLAGFVLPRVLPCGHSFCTNCIIRCMRHTNGRALSCPICKKDVGTMREDEIGIFPRNFDLEKLVELYAGIREWSAWRDQGRQPRVRPRASNPLNTSPRQQTVSGSSGQSDSDSEEAELQLAMQMSLAQTGSTVDPETEQEDEDLARAIYNSQIESNLSQTTEANGAGSTQHCVNLKIKNLHPSVTREEILQFFSPFGRITSSRVMATPPGRSKGYGFVCYENSTAARQALREMNGRTLAGWPIRVDVAQGSSL